MFLAIASKHPVVFNPGCRIILRFRLSGKAHNRRSLRQGFFGICQEVDHFSRVQNLYVVCVVDGHLKPKVKPDDELCH